MGYYVRELKWKKKKPNWKVQFVSHKKSDTCLSSARKPKKEWDVPKERWRALGFHNLMTWEEASVRAKQLNALEMVKRQERQIKALEQKDNENRLRYQSILPNEFVLEFEQRFIRKRSASRTDAPIMQSRGHAIWRAAKKK
jgi:hypothetical protein